MPIDKTYITTEHFLIIRTIPPKKSSKKEAGLLMKNSVPLPQAL
jgi:hypothetical protein